ncbi:MFS transporter [Hamadaea tsunoensis]|uniref:MFS transporter n=1 Tax=Hamadaea tsunoensis TaxID=53368 RepID=UPI00054DF0FC|nr:MFS transporter [Hamadaea tsunoensis]
MTDTVVAETPAAALPKPNRAERLIVPATFITNLGNGIQLTAVSYLVFTTKDTTLSVGWLFIAVAIPQVALSLFFGRLADRVDRRTLAVIADVGSAAVAIGLPVWLHFGGAADIASYVVSFALAILSALFLPASSALIKERIPEGRLGHFNANFEIALQAGTLLSAAIGGWVIAAVGVNPLFYFNGITFVGSAILLLLVGKRAPELISAAADAAKTAAAAVQQPIKRLALLYAIGNIVIIVGNTILIVLVIQGFKSDIGILGVTDAAFGIGVLFAAWSFKKLNAKFTTARVALIGYIAFATVLALETTNLWVLIGIIPFAGLTFGLARIAARTSLMKASPESRVGFIFGATNAFGLAAGTIATISISLLIDNSDVRYGFYALASLVVVIAAITVASLPKSATKTEATA